MTILHNIISSTQQCIKARCVEGVKTTLKQKNGKKIINTLYIKVSTPSKNTSQAVSLITHSQIYFVTYKKLTIIQHDYKTKI